MNKDITEQRVFTAKQLILIIVFVASITFSGTMIWSRFLAVESEIEINEDRAAKRNSRNIEDRRALWNEINSLKKEHN